MVLLAQFPPESYLLGQEARLRPWLYRLMGDGFDLNRVLDGLNLALYGSLIGAAILLGRSTWAAPGKAEGPSLAPGGRELRSRARVTVRWAALSAGLVAYCLAGYGWLAILPEARQGHLAFLCMAAALAPPLTLLAFRRFLRGRAWLSLLAGAWAGLLTVP